MSGETLRLGNDFTINRNAFQGKAIKLGEIKDEALKTYFETQFKAAKENEGKDLNNMLISEKDFEKLYDDLKAGAGNDKLTAKEAKKMGLAGDRQAVLKTFAAIKNLTLDNPNVLKGEVSTDGSFIAKSDAASEIYNKDGSLNKRFETAIVAGKTVTMTTDFENNLPAVRTVAAIEGAKPEVMLKIEYARNPENPETVDKETTTDLTTEPKTVTVKDFKNSAITVAQGAVVTDYEMDENGEIGRLKKETENLGQGVQRVTEFAYEGTDEIRTIREPGQEVKTVTVKLDGTEITVQGNTTTHKNPDGSYSITTVKDGVATVRNFGADGNEILPEPKEEQAPEPPKFSEVFEKAGKKVTIDEEGSTQRLTKDTQWETGVVIPKRAQYDGNGVPKEIAIELPSDYGSKGADGVAQKRYQTLKLVDPENNIYADKAGVRQFQLNVTEDGITLKQVNVDNDKTKTFLDNNVKQTEAKAVEQGQVNDGYAIGADKKVSHENTEIKIANKEDAQGLLGALKDRNLAWGAYTAVGTDNGNFNRNLGLMEYLADNDYATPQELSEAVNGLKTRVPESFHNDPSYATVEAMHKELAAGNKVDTRELDKALIDLAQKMDIQGTNFMPNQYLKGPAGNVTITPDRTDAAIWNTDAKFNLPTADGQKDFYFYRERAAMFDKTYDFQDIVGEGGLIENDSAGNNRRGEISFRADKLDTNKTYYFQTKGGEELPVQLEDVPTGQKDADGNDITTKVAFIYDENSNKVNVNDILNGRKPMPGKSVVPAPTPAPAPTATPTAQTTNTVNVLDPEEIELLDNTD